MLERYGRRNNIEISGIPDSVPDNELQNKVVAIFSAINVVISGHDFEESHRIGKSQNSSKKTIKRFVNWRVVKKALYNRKKLRTIDKTSMGFNNRKILLNENLTPDNNKIAYSCRKLKRDSKVKT